MVWSSAVCVEGAARQGRAEKLESIHQGRSLLPARPLTTLACRRSHPGILSSVPFDKTGHRIIKTSNSVGVTSVLRGGLCMPYLCQPLADWKPQSVAVLLGDQSMTKYKNKTVHAGVPRFVSLSYNHEPAVLVSWVMMLLPEQKEFGMPWDMRVVPLFETLDDLERSEATLR